jgi:peptide/nickel transport system substrate-binding protein
MTQLRAAAAQAGIRINLQPRPSPQVVTLTAGNCKAASLPCNWDLANWGTNWLFGPDYAPTGETLFKCGAIANSGGYCTSQNEALINDTQTAGNLSLMYQWQNYLASQLPVVFQPDSAYQLTEIASNLEGVMPQSPTLSITPENWYFVK